MFGADSTSRSKSVRPVWNSPKTRGRRSERHVTRAVKAVAESLERRMLLSTSAAMVADINVTTADSDVSALADLGNGKSVFFANDGYHGEEPFVTDGTAAGTTLLRDINPGPGNSPALIQSTIYSGYQPGVVANGRLFFGATDGFNHYELWSTDGTPDGTTLVKDIDPGRGSYPTVMVAVGHTLFFVANDGTNGPQLWKSDGTSDGSSMVTTIGNLPSPKIQLGVDFNNKLFFTADDGVHGDELWSSDGTAAGTAMVTDINPGLAASSPASLTVSGSQLFFVADDGTDGSELWATDGTSAGTHLVSDLAPSSASSTLKQLTDVNGTLFFEDLVGTSSDLYQSDGTSAGTVLVHQFNPYNAIVSSMVDYGGRDYFIANDGISGYELWQSDGTTAGTTQVADLAPGAASAFPNGIGKLTVAGPNLFFAANAGSGGQFYVISAVGAAPTPISSIGLIPGSSTQQLWASGSGLYFQGFSSAAGVELWHSDGTAADTGMVDDINATTVGSNPIQLTEINGHGVFVANDTVHGAELWTTDGSAGGTTLLKDIVPGPANGLTLDADKLPSFLPTQLGNYLYFAAGTGNGQLWRTDGTPNGTTLCLSFLPASTTTGDTGVSQLTSINGSLYFFADDGTGTALYISDGTQSGTTRLGYLSPPVSNLDDPSAPQFSLVGNHIVFAATDGTDGVEPWVTDGTPVGTMLLKDINPGAASSLSTYFIGSQRFVNLGSSVYFVVQSPSGEALWTTDGTSAGTSIVKDFAPLSISGVDELTPFNGRLYFSTHVRLNAGGGNLWTSDGTANGTVLVESFPSNEYVDGPSELTVVGNTLFFSAAPTASSPREQLFVSDGTAAGTMLVPGAGPGQAGIATGQLTNVQGTLYFTAEDQTGMPEVWRVDQSPEGALSIEDIWPAGPTAIPPNPTSLVGLDGTLFFQATDQAHGAELWKLNLLHADAGGPYLATGSTVQLDASASRDPNPSYPLTYSWDLNGDGIFGDTTLKNPSFYANQTFYPGVDPVTVEVNGSWQNTATATSYVTVPPRPHFAGDTVTFTLGTAVTNASIQSWTIDWGDGTPVENYVGSTTSVSHLFATASGDYPFMVQISAVGTGSAVQPLPMPVTIYADPVLNNGLLTLTGTSGDDLAIGANAILANGGGVFDVGLNGAIREYNSSLISRFIYNDGGGNDQINLRDSFFATLNLSTGNDSIINAGATAVVNAGTGKIRLDNSFGTTTFAASSGSGIRQIQFSGISISKTATVIFANSSATLGDYSNHVNRSVAVVDAGGLNIAAGGILDTGDNDLILQYAAGGQSSADSQVFNLLQSGITPAGDWSGTGITSSEANYDSNFGIGARALGWIDNNDVQYSSFDGVSLSDFNEIMIKFTYYGDVDISGTFDATDVNQLIAGRSHTPGNTGWEFDDLDYDGVTSTATDQNLFFTGRNAYQKFGVL